MPELKPLSPAEKKILYLFLVPGAAALTIGLVLGLVTKNNLALAYVSLGGSVACFAAALLRLWKMQRKPSAAAVAVSAKNTKPPKATAETQREASKTSVPVISANKPGESPPEPKDAAKPHEGAAPLVPAALPAADRKPAETQPEAVNTPVTVAPAKRPAVSLQGPKDSAKPHDGPAPPLAAAIPAPDVQPAEANGELAVMLSSTLGDLLQAALLKDPERVRRLQAELVHMQVAPVFAELPQAPVVPAPEAPAKQSPVASAS